MGLPLGDIRLYECPLSYITAETWEIIRTVYLVEDSKQLFFPGGWADQPYWLFEAVRIYKSELARRQDKECPTTRE